MIHVVMEVFLCKVLTLLPQNFPAFGICGRKVTIGLIVRFSLHSLSWCCFCAGSRETISRSTKRTTTQYADCTTAQVRRGKLHVHVHVKYVCHMICNRKRVAFFRYFHGRLLCEAVSFVGRVEWSGWGLISMERSLTTSSHSPLTLPYLTLKYSRLEVQPSKFGRSLFWLV